MAGKNMVIPVPKPRKKLAERMKKKAAEDQEKILQDNITFITENTANWPHLTHNMIQDGLLNESEMEIINEKDEDNLMFYEMYLRISKQNNWLKKFIQCLQESGNEQLVDVLVAAQVQLDQHISERIEHSATELEFNEGEAKECESIVARVGPHKATLSGDILWTENEKSMLEVQIQQLNKKLADSMAVEEAQMSGGQEAKTTGLALWGKVKQMNQKKSSQILKLEINRLQDALEELNKVLQVKDNQFSELLTQMNINESRSIFFRNLIRELETELDEIKATRGGAKLLTTIKLEPIGRIQVLQREVEELETERTGLLIKDQWRDRMPLRMWHRPGFYTGQQKVVTRSESDNEDDEEAVQEINSRILKIREQIENAKRELTVPTGSMIIRNSLIRKRETHPFLNNNESPNLLESEVEVSPDPEIVEEIDDHPKKECVFKRTEFSLKRFQYFQSLEEDYVHLTKMRIEDCEIQAQALLESLKLSSNMRSIRLLDVRLTGQFQEIVSLPYLEEYELSIDLNPDDFDFSTNNVKLLIFWSTVEDLEFDTLQRLQVDLDIAAGGRNIVQLNQRLGEFVKSDFASEYEILRLQCDHDDFDLRSLAIWGCQLQKLPQIALEYLTQLTLWKTEIIGSTFDLILPEMTSLEYLRIYPNTRVDINVASIPKQSLICMSINNADLKYSGSISSFSGLDELHLSHCHLDEELLRSFSNIFKSTAEITIELEHDVRHVGHEIIHTILQIPNLNSVRVENFNINSFKLESFQSSRSLLQDAGIDYEEVDSDEMIGFELTREGQTEWFGTVKEKDEFGALANSFFEYFGFSKFFKSGTDSDDDASDDSGSGDGSDDSDMD